MYTDNLMAVFTSKTGKTSKSINVTTMVTGYEIKDDVPRDLDRNNSVNLCTIGLFMHGLLPHGGSAYIAPVWDTSCNILEYHAHNAANQIWNTYELLDSGYLTPYTNRLIAWNDAHPKFGYMFDLWTFSSQDPGDRSSQLLCASGKVEWIDYNNWFASDFHRLGNLLGFHHLADLLSGLLSQRNFAENFHQLKDKKGRLLVDEILSFSWNFAQYGRLGHIFAKILKESTSRNLENKVLAAIMSDKVHQENACNMLEFVSGMGDGGYKFSDTVQAEIRRQALKYAEPFWMYNTPDTWIK